MVPAELTVEVVYCPRPGECDRVELKLPAGSTMDQALQASGLLSRHRLTAEGLRAGVWCKAKPGDTALRDGDRIEVYRELTVDPKEARRLRYKGKRTAGKASEAGKAGA